MGLCNITLFKNTPITDFYNTIHFSSNAARDQAFLLSDNYEKITFSTQFNFVRDRLVLSIPAKSVGITYADLAGVNYCTWLSNDDPERYYAIVVEIQYINDNCINLVLVVDVLCTFTQGNALENITGVSIERQHLSKSTYDELLYKLKTNDDILKTYTKQYVYNSFYEFSDFWVIFTCSQDLSADFGGIDDGNKPILTTSRGNTFDKITSPLDIYVCRQQEFYDLMGYLKNYPWVSENIKEVLLIPGNFIKQNTLTPVTLKNVSFNGLYTFIYNSTTSEFSENIPQLSVTNDQMYTIHGLNREQEGHLLRNEYTTIEYYSYDGQSLYLDPGQFDKGTFGSNNLSMKMLVNIGYNNHISFFPMWYKSDQYKEPDYESGKTMYRGSFLQDALHFTNFDRIPVLVDNVILSQARTNNRRELADARQISGRVSTIFDNDSTIQDRFYNIANVLSGGLKPSHIIGRLSDEYEYYRQQKAEFADMALSSPNVSGQTYSNSFHIANGIWGVTLKIASLSDVEWKRVRKYYKLFGYEVKDDFGKIEPIDSMTVCNYLKISGQWQLPNIDTNLNQQLVALLENGVRFWHYDGTPNPMERDVLTNVMVK